jgi:hypothetical protein
MLLLEAQKRYPGAMSRLSATAGIVALPEAMS